MAAHAPPTFWRSPRMKPPLPRQVIELPAPPGEPSDSGESVIAYILPTLTIAIVMATVAVAMGNTNMLGYSLPMILASGGVSAGLFISRRRKARDQAEQRKQRYSQLITQIEDELDALRRQQAEQRKENDPSPEQTLERVQALDRRMWARRPEDDDFLCLRIGTGDLPSTVTIKLISTRDPISPDPLAQQANAMASRFLLVPDVPLTLNVAEIGVIGIAGERAAVQQMAHAMILQAAAWHAPGELKIAALIPEAAQESWRWLRWLPHTWSDDHTTRYLAADHTTSAMLLSHLDGILEARRRMAADKQGSSGQRDASPPPFSLLLFLADDSLFERNPFIERLILEGPAMGLYPIFLSSRTRFLPQACRVSIRLGNGQANLIQQGVQSSGALFLPDLVQDSLTRDFALAMAPIRLRQPASREIPTLVTLLEMIGVTDIVDLRIPERWKASTTRIQSVAAPLGHGAGHDALWLDLHENDRADGPHGLVAGTSGAGKSELLQTLVASLALHYHPHQLAFVLIDYKGGGMADPFLDLPHTLGIITNLQQESLAVRALTSLTIELQRRLQIFADVGLERKHIDDYMRRYYEGRLPANAEPIPYLVVIVDEFAEMKTEQPEVAKEFIRIARLGRSAGLRLILAMQKTAGIVDSQIEANTRFRLCLRVAQTEDSNAMIKRPDAAWLAVRGRCILLVGANEKYREFQVAWGGATYDPEARRVAGSDEIARIAFNGSRTKLDRERRARVADAEAEKPSQLKALVDAIRATAAASGAHKLPMLWLPPLPAALALPAVRPDTGWDGRTWRPVDEWLAPVIGLLDRPRERKQTPLALPLGREGHLAIYSAPRYGKTTALLTLAMALAQTHSPQELNIYALDFDVRLLRQLEALPHVGAVVCGDETERLERLALFLRRTLDERGELLGAAGAASLPEYRSLTGRQIPALVVLLDNYASFMDVAGENEALPALIARIAQEGGARGVHLVLTANNASTIRFAISSNIMLAFALHMVEPSDSATIVGRAEDLAPPAIPGRGLLRGNPVLEGQIALPAEGETEAARSVAMRAAIAAMAAAWQGPRPVRIELLPEVVALEAVHARWGAQPITAGLPLGLNADDLEPFTVEPGDGIHYLVAGTVQSGRSTLLRTWAWSLARLETPQQSRIMVIDSQRQSLTSLQELAHVIGYAATHEESDELLQQALTLAEEMRRDRQAGRPVPRLTLLVDDLWDAYDDTVSDEGKELLGRLLRESRGIPLHLVIAGRQGDLGTKTWREPIKTLKETQRGIILGNGGDDALLNTRLSYHDRNRPLPVGEGYAVHRGLVSRVRIAVPT